MCTFIKIYKGSYIGKKHQAEITSGFQVSACKRFETGGMNLVSFKHQVFLEGLSAFQELMILQLLSKNTQNS